MADTVVIDITVKSNNKANTGGKVSISNLTRLNKAIDETKGKADVTKAALDKINSTAALIGKKAINIPVKIVDYATKSLKGIMSFAKSVNGILSSDITKKVVFDPISLADDYTTANNSFLILLKSKSKATKMMSDIDNLATSTSLESTEIIPSSKKMLTSGWKPNDVINDITTMANASIGTSGGTENLQNIISALTNIKKEGKLSTEQLNILTKEGINVEGYLAKGLGYKKDTGFVQLGKDIENGLIGSDIAIEKILQGMGEYDGLLEKTSNTTVKDLKSNIEETFSVNILRKWGQGLQDGAVKGLSGILEFLDKNKEKLKALGDAAEEFASKLSTGVMDSLQYVLDKLMEVTNTQAFADADFFGKIKILWDDIIWTPFTDWWEGEGGNSFRDKAMEIGESIGKFICDGIGFAVGEIVPNMFFSASKILPGGEKADTSSYVSAALLGYGGLKLGNGASKLFTGESLGKNLFGKMGSLGTGKAAVGVGAKAGGLALPTTSIIGAVIGGLGLASSISDFKTSAKSVNEKEKDVSVKSGIIKGGAVAAGAGAGAGLGAILGSFVPGLGTLVGTGIGAGIGGLVALMKGDDLGQMWSDFDDGTAKIKEITGALEESTTSYQEFYDKSAKTNELVKTYKELKKKIDDGKLSSEEAKDAQQKYNDTIAELRGMYPGLISDYDMENGKLDKKFGLLQEIAENEKKLSEIELERNILEFDRNLPELTQRITEYEEKVRISTDKADSNIAKSKEADEYRKKAEGAIKAYEEKNGEGSNKSLYRIENGEGGYIWKRLNANGEYEETADTKEYAKAAEPIIKFYEEAAEELGISLEPMHKTLDIFTESDISGKYLEKADGYIDSNKKDRELLTQEKEALQTGYDVKITKAIIDSGIDIGKYEKKIEEINVQEEKINTLKKSLGKETNAKVREGIEKDLKAAEDSQKKLVKEVNKVKEPLIEVYKQIEAINSDLGKLVTEKFDIEVGIKYFEINEKEDKPNKKSEAKKEEINLPPGVTNKPSPSYPGLVESQTTVKKSSNTSPDALESERMARMNASANERGQRASSQATINLGGINIDITGGDSDSVMTAIETQMPEIADNLCSMLASKFSLIYGNMPLSVEEV